jgi:hypothetical protein
MGQVDQAMAADLAGAVRSWESVARDLRAFNGLCCVGNWEAADLMSDRLLMHVEATTDALMRAHRRIAIVGWGG